MFTKDRRRHPRVKLQEPLRGSAGESRIYVVDASIGGIRVAHQASLPPPGGICRIEVPSEMGPIRLDCEVVRTVSQPSRDPSRVLYYSGLAVVAADLQSVERLRSIFENPEGDLKAD
jgi:PilZ domain.